MGPPGDPPGKLEGHAEARAWLGSALDGWFPIPEALADAILGPLEEAPDRADNIHLEDPEQLYIPPWEG